MGKNIQVFLLIVFFLNITNQGNAGGGPRVIYDLQNTATVTGTIQRMDRNTVEIFDERNKRKKRLVYLFAGRNEFKKGDRVRIYYSPVSGLVDTIKKMTPVEYKKDGQNTGYILRNN